MHSKRAGAFMVTTEIAVLFFWKFHLFFVKALSLQKQQKHIKNQNKTKKNTEGCMFMLGWVTLPPICNLNCCSVLKQRWFLSYCCCQLLESNCICILKYPNLEGEEAQSSAELGDPKVLGGSWGLSLEQLLNLSLPFVQPQEEWSARNSAWDPLV